LPAGIETFDKLFRASPHIPILIFSRLRDEDAARLALQRERKIICWQSVSTIIRCQRP
jgi:hypothetical protein